MKWSWPRFFVILTVVLLVAGIGTVVYLVRARMRGNDYQFQVDAILAASAVANQGEISADPAVSVIASWGGQQWVISPENYTALSAYLRRDAGMPLFMRMKDEPVLTVTCCNEAVFRIAPANDEGDAILIELKTGSETFRMRARGGLLWDNLLACCTKGTYHGENLLLGD